MIGRSEYPKATPFMDRIQFEPMSGCWLWDGSTDSKGYGQFRDPISNKNLRAHRVSYEINKGVIPIGLELDHLCRNRCCVNPDHLEPVTHRINNLRGNSVSANNSKKTNCPNGHAYDLANTRINVDGSRKCKHCDRIMHEALRRARNIPIKVISTQCPSGHEKNGARHCKICDRLAHKARRDRMKP